MSDTQHHKLIARYLSGKATPEELRRLKAWIKSDPEARATLFEAATPGSGLNRVIEGYLDLDDEIEDATMGQPLVRLKQARVRRPPAALKSLPAEVRLHERRRRLRLRQARWMLAVAVSISIASISAVLIHAYLSRSVAQLVAVSQPRWEMSRPAPAIGAALVPGTLTLRSGLVELRFDRGTVLVVEGPAQIELRTDDLVFLRRGKLFARVPQKHLGFRVETPSCRIVDMGTAFGVAVEPTGFTEVHVDQGMVEASTVLDAGAAPRKRMLIAGEAARFEPRPAAPIVELQAQPAVFARRMPDGR